MVYKKSCLPTHVLCPKNLQEVQELIKHAYIHNIALRFVGTQYSWPDLLCTSGYLVSTRNFTQILAIDKNKHQIRVQAGITLTALHEELARHMLALSNQSFTTGQTLAGAIATATHGSGHTGTLSDFVVALEVVDAQGTLYTVSADSYAHWLAALRVHLGALGFIYSVTLQCEPLFVLKHTRSLISWDICIRDYAELYSQTDYCMFMGLAHAPTALYLRWNRTDKPATNNYLKRIKDRILFSILISKLSLLLARTAPQATNKLLNWSFKLMQQKTHMQYSYKTLSPLIYPNFIDNYTEEEYALCFDSFTSALQEIQTVCRRHHNLVSIITCRFGPGCALSYLGQNYKRDTAYISVTILNQTEETIQLYQELAKLMSTYNGRPHWGKHNRLTKKTIIALYGDSAHAFNQVRKELDPTGIFTNDFIKRCFD